MVGDRFWSKVDRRGPDECWPWLASTSWGYGEFSLGGKLRKAHRVAYEDQVGPIPAGLTIDHLCRNESCVNPRHLEPVTMRENTMRGTGPTATNARKTVCKRGHPYTPENTYRSAKGRECRVCRAGYMPAWRARKKGKP